MKKEIFSAAEPQIVEGSRETGGKAYLRLSLGTDKFTKKRVRKNYTITFKNGRDLDRQVAAIKRGIVVTSHDGNTPLKEVAESFGKSREGFIEPTTAEADKQKNKAVMRYFKEVSVGDITADDVRGFVAALLDGSATAKGKPMSRSTVRLYLEYLKMVLNFAVDEEYIASSPAERVKVPPKRKDAEEEEKEVNIIGIEAAATIHKMINDEFYVYGEKDGAVAIALAVALGLRKGEIYGLKLEDINLYTGELNIVRQRTNSGNIEFVKKPKTRKSSRPLKIPEPILPMVRDLKRYHLEYGLQHGLPQSEYLILDRALQPVGYTFLNYRLKCMLARYGAEHITPHGLRHTFGSWLYSNPDTNITEVSAAMGHNNVSTTLNTYISLTKTREENAAKMADEMARILEGVSN